MLMKMGIYIHEFVLYSEGTSLSENFQHEDRGSSQFQKKKKKELYHSSFEPLANSGPIHTMELKQHADNSHLYEGLIKTWHFFSVYYQMFGGSAL